MRKHDSGRSRLRVAGIVAACSPRRPNRPLPPAHDGRGCNYIGTAGARSMRQSAGLVYLGDGDE